MDNLIEMIQDSSFFGFARMGTISDTIEYPLVLDITKGEHVMSDLNSITILGNKFKREIVYPEALNLKVSQEYLEGEDLILVFNALELLQRPDLLLKKLSKIRRERGFTKLIYAQGVANPYIIPVLVYAGIQIFDDSYIRAESAKRIKYTIFGKIQVDYNPLEENIAFVREQEALLRRAINNGTLREVVEKFSISTKAVELLRILDYEYYWNLEAVFPSRTPYIKANNIESLQRPDLRRYRGKLLSNYARPDGGDVALILPCSARKPYSISNTHRAILSQIGEFRKYIHEIIVTSPVGIVPRELEEGYPSRFYDIPVIGLWYEEEKKMMLTLLENFLKKNKYNKVIAYISEDLDFIRDALPLESRLIKGEIRNPKNIELLKQALTEVIYEEDLKGKGRTKLDDYLSIAGFQFGQWIRDQLHDTKIVTSYNQDMIVKEGQIQLVYNRAMGKFTINKNSAKLFLDKGYYLVEIDDFKPTSNVYAVGVMDATEDIRPEDEVVLVHKGEIRGVGIAKMPYRAMVELEKGIAVKVRS